MGEIFVCICLILSYDEFKEVDIVIEVVIENLKVKGIVFVEIEKNVCDNMIIVLNILIILIIRLVENL